MGIGLQKFSGGLNAAASALLAIVLVGMLNYLAYRNLHVRWDVSSQGYYTLSQKTLNLLQGIEGEIRVITLFKQNDPLATEAGRLLKEYEFAAAETPGLKLTVESIDPDRDLTRTREVADAYGLDKVGVVVLTLNGRHKVVGEADMIEYQRQVDLNPEPGQPVTVRRTKTAFRGELAFSSAIMSLTQQTVPRIYFLSGHGERDLSDFGSAAGYGGIVRLLRRDNVLMKSMLLAAGEGVPTDCDLLVVAGPQRRLAQAEVDAIGSYLERSGRVLMLLDPENSSGLEPLLEKWGVRVGRDVVVGMTLSGRELFVSDYGRHAITRPMMGLATMFLRPGAVEPASGSEAGPGLASDAPQVVVLAACSDKGWAERNPAESPMRFDEERDRRGPVGVAVAVERGPASGIEVQLKPARLVVLGDSDFVANGILKSGIGGNADLFLNAVNWLLEREEMIAISPKPPNDLRLDMDATAVRQTYLILAVGVPGVAALLGLWVWVRRRK